MDQDNTYIGLTTEKPVRPALEIQIKQREIDILKSRLNHALKSIDSIQTLLTEQTKELKLFMTDINNEIRTDNGEI